MFPNEIINDKVNKYFTDLVFPVHKLGIEVDENGHLDRCDIKEQERQKIIKKRLGLRLLELILTKKTLIFLMKLVKYKVLFLT